MLFGIINLISANWGMRKYFNIEKMACSTFNEVLNICFVNKHVYIVASVCIRLSSLTPGRFSDSRAIVFEGPGMVWSMMRSWIPLCFFCAPQVEDCATQTVNGAWNPPAMHYGWGKVHLIFSLQLSLCGSTVYCVLYCIS